MSRDLQFLTEDFQIDVDELLSICDELGVVMRPFFTLRTPWAQARLWRQSRTYLNILRTEEYLRDQNADYLADILIKVGAQNGPHVTNSIPGNSWHQYGAAVDCFWVVDENSNWSYTELVNGVNGYHVYSKTAIELGLRSGSSWGDWPHIQKPKESAPNKTMSWEDINRLMSDKFGLNEL